MTLTVLLVNVFVQWLDSQEIPKDASAWVKATALGEPDETDQLTTVEILQEMFKVLVLSERFEVRGLRRAVQVQIFDAFIDLEQNPSNETIVSAFAMLPSNSLVLDFIVDMRCRYGPGADREKDEGEGGDKNLPHEFLLRAMHQFYDAGCPNCVDDRVGEFDICDYHEHASEEERRRCPRRLE